MAEAMFRDVLAAALGATAADHVAVVTSDAGLLAMARAADALAIDEEFPRGLNVAVALGDLGADCRRARDTVCTVLSDIPLVTAEDIDAVFAAMPSTGAARCWCPRAISPAPTSYAARPPTRCRLASAA